MKYSNINQITENEIRILIQEQVQENTHLEYKREIKFSSDAEKKELLADVCSFANSGGGIILYGIEEEKDNNGKNTGIPKQVTDSRVNIDEKKRSLDESIKRNIEPVLIGLNINSIEVDKKTLLIIFIPQSFNLPHRVSFKGNSKFWKRASANKYEIPIEELRQDFLKGMELSKRISEFRSERVTKILSNDTPVILRESPKLVLHIIPVNFFNEYQVFESFNQFNPSEFRPITSSSGPLGERLNFDGYVAHDLAAGKPMFCYTQVFRSSTIEAVYSLIVDDKRNLVTLQNSEKYIVDALKRYCATLVKKSVRGPCTIFLSILNVKGCNITFGSATDFIIYDKKPPIDRNNLLLPDVYIENINNFSAPELMKPAFDMVWNACGYPGSKNYDENGEWKPSV